MPSIPTSASTIANLNTKLRILNMDTLIPEYKAVKCRLIFFILFQNIRKSLSVALLQVWVAGFFLARPCTLPGSKPLLSHHQKLSQSKL